MNPRLANQPWLLAESTQRIMQILEARGRPARFVGGCVRDSLLCDGLDSVDIDIATAERPEAVMNQLRAEAVKVIPTGLKHGTVTAVLDDRFFEITTLRLDVETDGRHAEVAFTDDFDLDAARRDFTINALRADRHGEVADPFGGIDDLARGTIRFVGDPEHRVVEDYLRILRYFRFFARFGRLPADSASLTACRHQAAGLERIAGERIQAEMTKLLAAANAAVAAELMIESGIQRHVLLPAVDLTPFFRLSTIEPHPDWQICLAVWLRAGASDLSDLLALSERWRLANADRKRLECLCLETLPDPAAPATDHRRYLYRLGREDYGDLLLIAQAMEPSSAEALEAAQAIVKGWQKPVFPMDGDDLKKRGVVEGPALGECLQALEGWWRQRDFKPDRAALLTELDRRLANERPIV
ncbi:MAG: CCA tRNA nucleotidyltransferase [Pseudomonadota bacterium]